MRLIFMGTPNFAATALQKLIDAGHEICAVYSQPPRPAKRGQKLQRSAVHQLAETQGLAVFTPPHFRDKTTQATLAAFGADIIVVAAYGLLLPPDVLNIPAKGCLNIHASLLPRWRGAAPIHRAIEAGDTQTGISIMQMQRGLDTGPVLLSRSCQIDPSETTGDLHQKLAQMGGTVIVEALDRLAELPSIPQPREGILYAAKVTKDEMRIDWSQSPVSIVRKILAFSPSPGAWFEIEGERIKVLRAHASSGGLLNMAGVELLELQRAGKRAQPVETFVQGLDPAKRQAFVRLS